MKSQNTVFAVIVFAAFLAGTAWSGPSQTPPNPPPGPIIASWYAEDNKAQWGRIYEVPRVGDYIHSGYGNGTDFRRVLKVSTDRDGRVRLYVTKAVDMGDWDN